VAIVQDGRPLGLLARDRFLDRYAKPYFKEIYGRRACTEFANLTPHFIDVHFGIEELTAILTSDDPRYLTDGVVITKGQVWEAKDGRYHLVGTEPKSTTLVHKGGVLIVAEAAAKVETNKEKAARYGKIVGGLVAAFAAGAVLVAYIQGGESSGA
jgi:hypothetical protein